MLIDLHVHTRFSDGKMSVEEVVRAALSRGLGGIAVTDHDCLEGGKALTRYVKKHGIGIIAIPGIEVSTKYAHILVYGVSELPKSESILELIDKIHDDNGIAIFAHPFGKFFLFKYPLVDFKEALEKIDAIECINGRVPWRSNLRAFELARFLGKPCIGGSDAHIPEEVGVAYTEVYDEVLSVVDFIEVLRKAKVKAFGGRSFASIVKSIIMKHLR